MKTLKAALLIVLFLGTWNSLFSQEYLLLPEMNGQWVNTYSERQWPTTQMGIVSAVAYCTSNQDTLINELTYFTVDTCNSGGNKGAFRNDSGKVWYVPGGLDTEFLLYDFTAQAGDILTGVYMEPGITGSEEYFLGELTVEFVDSVLINGSYRKRMSVGGAQWIEGIGNTFGLFKESFFNVSDYRVDLYCMSVNDTILYPEFSVGAHCELPPPVGVSEMTSSNPQVSITPNPSSTDFVIELLQPNRESAFENAVVYTTYGQRVFPTVQIENNKIIVEMSAFPKGAYIVSLVNAGAVIVRKIIKE